jgi:hypothetical protein
MTRTCSLGFYGGKVESALKNLCASVFICGFRL